MYVEVWDRSNLALGMIWNGGWRTKRKPQLPRNYKSGISCISSDLVHFYSLRLGRQVKYASVYHSRIDLNHRPMTRMDHKTIVSLNARYWECLWNAGCHGSMVGVYSFYLWNLVYELTFFCVVQLVLLNQIGIGTQKLKDKSQCASKKIRLLCEPHAELLANRKSGIGVGCTEITK
ncbi:hypothetical protein BCR42DRAFT_438202 [Absidia repens]|uniref:Uncharacterized protein n=1 Tax=Absidia repens TaxID=90262 RepID=A0A1X2IGA6_9FUNG|nr:hypothetical protein BCR42DRAFT_438202 [Absidia repens]